MKYFSLLDRKVPAVLELAGRQLARRRFLRMSDRQLDDIGISRNLLLEGVSAWPWRSVSESSATVLNPARSVTVDGVAGTAGNVHVIDQAIKELSAYSDRELSELGLSRNSIRQAVLHGVSSHDASEAHRHAA